MTFKSSKYDQDHYFRVKSALISLLPLKQIEIEVIMFFAKDQPVKVDCFHLFASFKGHKTKLKYVYQPLLQGCHKFLD